MRKFTFETEFGADGAIVRDGDAFKTQFNKAEVEAVRAEAFEEGRRTSEREAAQALTLLSQSMRALLDRYEIEQGLLRDEAVAVALAAARKAADIALESFGEDRVIVALEAAMECLRGTPRVVVRLAPTMIAGIKSRLEDAARIGGFDGALIVRADPAVAIGDVILEWPEGAIAHDRAAAFARIDEVVQRTLTMDDLEHIE
jgi:flagellar biosynthesis/type III secretory pathway protein FliH